MKTRKQIPSSNNESWGFFGSMGNHANKAWPLAMSVIADITDQTLESVQIFLDSRHGRHFADDVLNQMHKGYDLQDSINATTQKWMEWKVGKRISNDYGIPRGIPYLTGFVIHCEIVEESRVA